MIRGNLKKMLTENAEIIKYYLLLGGDEIYLNDLIGKKIGFTYQNQINCIKCGRNTKKSFSQGFCYPCFQNAPETEECVLRPELCRAHEGVARDLEYSKNHCLIDHYVYLSLTSDVKVGVTRHTQIPTRWIDQGATYAIKLARTPNRHYAGKIEAALKSIMADKTNWRHMLTGKSPENIDLISEKQKVIPYIPVDLKKFISDDNLMTRLNYPINQYPQKINSYNFDKTPAFQGILTGIKGQYLYFDHKNVVNIRKFSGYLVDFELYN